MKKVVKFGGSSLASAEQFKKVGEIIRSDAARRYVVPSAPGKRHSGDTKVTDLLYQLYDSTEDEALFQETLEEIKGRYQEIIDGLSLDLDLSAEFAELEKNFRAQCGREYAASRGEYLNGHVMAAYLGFPFVDPADMILFHNDGTLNAEETESAVAERLKDYDCAVVPGFYGRKEDGSIATFSRGGSDVTGSVIAGAIHADLYENWTDVSGFLCADPHIVEDPAVIETITYQELRELSYMGAGVMHEDAIFPVRKEGIPINIRNTNRPEDSGTMIVSSTCRKPRYTITGIAGKKGFCSITVDKDMMNSEIGFCRKVLQVFEDNDISLEHMPSGIDSMTIVVHQSEFLDHEQKIVTGIHRAVHPDQIILEDDLALIAVVGRGMKDQRGTAARVFAALTHERINVKMIDQGSSEFNIIIGVKGRDFENAIRAIYTIFVLTQI
ncbi:aspartate kinase [Stomatobaculum longum]|jgi:aspartate kinase|uniref:Aspartokinase n=2 Tax=Stomatobaculum longum TaxID=796942 RepID=A0AA37DGY4_9FIRM|nr:aspartate kinase [Stomatobaculum longum]EHO17694.1 aspartate kinase [Stomatobaculum longum]